MADSEQVPGAEILEEAPPGEAPPGEAAVEPPVAVEEAAAAAVEPAVEAADVPVPVEAPVGTASSEAAAAAAAAVSRAAALAAHFAAQAGDANGYKRKLDDGTEGGEPATKRMHEDPLASLSSAGGEATETIQVPSTLIGKLIGKAGSTIKDIQARGMAHVKINHDVSEGDTKPVTITGTPEHVAATKALIAEALDPNTGSGGPPGVGHEEEANRKISCPSHIVGRIIGRGGETIRSLQTASSAHIVINQNFPEGQPREIEIKGAADSVERAYNMVMEIINSDGSAQPQALIQKFGQGLTNELTCPKHMVGRLIGRGGETVKGLQRQYGATIQIDQNATPCKVTITGPAQAVAAAERAVMDLIEDRVPGGPGGHGGPGGYGGFPAPYGAPGPYGGAPYMGYPPHAFPGYGAPAYGGYPGGYPQGYGGYPYAQDPYAAAYAGGAQQQMGQQQQQQQQQQQAAGSGAAAPAAGGGAAVWQELKDEQNRSYFYNSQTGVSQWEKPADM